MPQRCIVIGASAGGVAALKELVRHLPADLPVPVFVVLHVPAYTSSALPSILNKVGPLPAIHPEDNTKIKPGTIYVAPPDHHLLLDDGHVAVKKGPRENSFRPSIDALFRSAAYTHGPGTIGVILSGALYDGTSGLWTIKRMGGIAIVQDPVDAQFESMPRSALEYVQADYNLPVSEIGSVLSQLVNEPSNREEWMKNESASELKKRVAREVQIAAGTAVSQKTILQLGELSEFTCPECHGTLTRIQEGARSRFRCHTGHSYSEDALLERATQSVGEMIWQVTRGLQEVEMLLEHMGGHIRDAGDQQRAEKFLKKAREIGKQALRFQELALDHESLSREKLDDPNSSDD